MPKLRWLHVKGRKAGIPLSGAVEIAMTENDKGTRHGELALSRNKLFVFFLTYMGYLCLYGTRKPFSVVKTSMQVDLNLSTYALGHIDTAFLSSYAIGQIVIPFLGDWFGIRPVICVAYLGSGVCSFLFGSASKAFILSFLWFMNGLFHAAVFPLLVKSVASCFPSELRGRALGMWTTSQQLGSMLATAFSSFIAGLIGWRAAFIAPALVVGLYGLVLLSFLPEPNLGNPNAKLFSIAVPSSKSDEASASDSAVEMYEMADFVKPRLTLQDPEGIAHRPTPSFADKVNDQFSLPEQEANALGTCRSMRPSIVKSPTLKEIFWMPDLLNVAIAYFFVKMIRYSLLFWLPYFLAKQLNYDATVAGYSSMMFDVGGIGGAVFTGYVSDHFMRGRRLTTATIMCAASGVALWGFALSSHIGITPMLFAMAVLGFTVAGPDSVLGAAAAQDLCDRSHYGFRGLSSAAGVINGMGSAGAVVQGYMTAHVAQKRGWDAVFMTLCVFSVFSLLLLLRPVMTENRLIAAANVKSLGKSSNV